ncbi:MAG: hypothetical protein JNK67_27375 [Alphaproteobacteria bacterium]|nr:hypothetical protein [Alphaproteobacteria bacterium]
MPAKRKKTPRVEALAFKSGLRCERITLKPGERTGYHAHFRGMPYKLIACTKVRSVRLDKDGKFIEILRMEPGETLDRPAGFAHDLVNAADHDVVMMKVYDDHGGRGGSRK